MEPATILLLVERVLPERPSLEAAPRYMIDITMLALTQKGRERTPAEFQKLLTTAGFDFHGIVPTGGPYDIVTAQKN